MKTSSYTAKKRITAVFLVLLIPMMISLAACSGDAFKKYEDARNPGENPVIPDTSAPEIASVKTNSYKELAVVFNEEIDPATAQTALNYHIQGNNQVKVNEAVLGSDNKTVTLTVSTGLSYGMQQGKDYTLLVQRVKDVSDNHNAIVTVFSQFTGKGEVAADVYYNGSALPTDSTSYVTTNSPVFTVTGDTLIAYMYSFDGSSWSTPIPVNSSASSRVLSFTSLSEGIHALKVVGEGTSGTWQDISNSTAVAFIVDTVAPTAVLSNLPLSVTRDTFITIAVKGEGVATYKYRINNEAWNDSANVSTAIKRIDLTDGTYTLYVRGSDAAGNEQTSDSTYTWKVVSDEPVPALSGLPSASTRSTILSVAVSGTDVNFYKYAVDDSWSSMCDVSKVISVTGLSEGKHTLRIIGYKTSDTGTAGSEVSYSWTVDTTAPTAAISNLPDNPSSSQSAIIVVSSAVNDILTYKYRITVGSIQGDLIGPVDVTTPITLSSLAANTYTVSVLGIDAAGNIQSESNATSYTWSVDISAPAAVLSNLPASITNVSNISLTVGGADVVAYKYLIDSESWSGEISSAVAISRSGIADGLHTVSVIARDTAGNWQSIQASTDYSWIIDTKPPTIELSNKPALVTSSTYVSFSIGGSGVVKYEYRLDGGSWSAETNKIENGALTAISYTGLAAGSHTIEAIGIDLAGNYQSTSTPTVYTWTIDTTVPSAELFNTPDNSTNIDSIAVSVKSSSCVSYKYQLDNSGSWIGPYSPGTDIISKTGLSQGSHILQVIGENASGLWQDISVATECSWTIDKEAPLAVVTAADPLPVSYGSTAIYTSSNNAVFTVSGTGVSKFKVAHRLPGASWTTPSISDFSSAVSMTGDVITHKIVYGTPANIDSSYYTSPLSDGIHAIFVIGCDDAGNWQDISDATFYEWSIDTTNPVAVLTVTTPSSTSTNSKTLVASVSGTNITAYKYRINGGSWSYETAVSNQILRDGSLTDGTYTLDVIGENSAGTWQPESSPTTYTWTVDLTAPTADDLKFDISYLPSNPTADTTAAFRVTGVSSNNIPYIKYKLDNGSWSSAVAVSTDDGSGTLYAPISLTGLSENSHTIFVIGCDQAGNWMDPSVATDKVNNNYEKTWYSWTVDLHSPIAVLTTYPSSNPSNDNDLSADFTVGGVSIAEYSYNLDGAGWSTWRTVGVLNLGTLLDGSHTLLVRGTKSAGDYISSNAQTVANASVFTWTIDTAAPTAQLSNLPSDGTSTDISVTIGGTDVVAYRYQFDNASPDGTDSSQWLPAGTDRTVDFALTKSLSEGSHILSVQGRDLAGNWSAVVNHSWTITQADLIAPATVVDGSYSSGYLKFNWTLPTGANAVLIQISKDSSFTAVVTSVLLGAVGTYSYLPTSTDINTYYARVYVTRNTSATNDLTDSSNSWKGPGTASSAIQVVGDLTGRVMNGTATSTAIASVSVQVYDPGSSSYLTLTGTTSATGYFTIYNVPIRTTSSSSGAYYLDFTKNGYQQSRKNTVVVARGEMTDIGTIYMVPSTATNLTISGTIVNANDGSTISGAAIVVNDGTGSQVATATSASNGTFTTTSITTAAVCSLVVSQTGYFVYTKDNVVTVGTTNLAVDRLAICEVLVEPQVRVIFQWGSAPADIDMHLVGPTERTVSDALPNNRFHIWYSVKTYSEATGSYTSSGDSSGSSSTASLVQDDTTSYGPEAINLFKSNGAQYAKGIYTYTLHNYTNGSGGDYTSTWGSYTGVMAARIYDSGGLVREISYPTSTTDYHRCWKLCKINIQGNSRSKRTVTVPSLFSNLSFDTKSSMDW